MDHDADDTLGPQPASAPGSRAIGGFFGWGLAGTTVSLMARPVGVALAVVGVARTLYTSMFARGPEVTFPKNTVMQVQLAPGTERASPERAP